MARSDMVKPGLKSRSPQSKSAAFDYTLEFDRTDFRAHPELYRVGKGEQGVLLVRPYKDELVPHWRFRTPEIARESAAKLLEMFEQYKAQRDFVGMDMARKFIQMGWTRSRRYANHKSGRKWSTGRAHVLPDEPDPVKAESAAIFFAALTIVRSDQTYRAMSAQHRDRYER